MDVLRGSICNPSWMGHERGDRLVALHAKGKTHQQFKSGRLIHLDLSVLCLH